MMIVVVGPTASGKSKLAIQLAKLLDTEIVSADSRSVYRELDIGTAKPTAEDRGMIRHHLLDIRSIGEPITVVEFRVEADRILADVMAKGKTPILVGGSGLYIDSILFDYQFPSANDRIGLEQLQGLKDDEMIEFLQRLDPGLALRTDLHNRRRVIRAIQTAGAPRSKLGNVRSDAIVIGLTMYRDVARQRIVGRVKAMVDAGFLEEVQMLGESYGWDSPLFAIIGYKAMKDVALGTKSLEQGILDFADGDMALYKKQMTWFRRNPEIHWIDTGEHQDVVGEALHFLRENGISAA